MGIRLGLMYVEEDILDGGRVVEVFHGVAFHVGFSLVNGLDVD